MKRRGDLTYTDWRKYAGSLIRPRYSREWICKDVKKRFADAPEDDDINDYLDSLDKTAQLSRELSFYQSQYEKSQKNAGLVNEIADLLIKHVKVINNFEPWRPARNANKKPEETLLCMNADQHIGFIVDEYEIPKGGQEYNPNVAQERIEEYSQTVLKITEYHRQYENINECHLTYLGDGIEGDWKGLNMSKDNIVKQYYKAYAVFASQIELFARNFQQVHVHCVYGNHSRMDKGLPQYVNWEYLLWAITMPIIFKEIPNVTFDVPSTPFCNFSIYDWRLCAIHGGGIKMHYKTPYYGIDSASKEYNEIFQEFEAGRFQYMLMGHFHECASLSNNKIKMCGSTVGYHPWGVSAIRKYSPPSQKMCLVHHKHGMVVDRDISL